MSYGAVLGSKIDLYYHPQGSGNFTKEGAEKCNSQKLGVLLDHSDFWTQHGSVTFLQRQLPAETLNNMGRVSISSCTGEALMCLTPL